MNFIDAMEEIGISFLNNARLIINVRKTKVFLIKPDKPAQHFSRLFLGSHALCV